MRSIMLILVGVISLSGVACGPGIAEVRLLNESPRTGITLYLDQNDGDHQYTIYAEAASGPGDPSEVHETVIEGTYDWTAERTSPGGIVAQGTIDIMNDKRALYQDVGLERFEWFDE